MKTVMLGPRGLKPRLGPIKPDRFARMRTGSRRLAGATLVVALCSGVPEAGAQSDWIPQLQPAQGEYRGRSDTIVIILPAGLDAALYGRLAVELDDLDVSIFAASGPGSLTLSPPEPLSTGNHSLRLIERGEDGSILERGAWVLEIRHSGLIRDLAVEADLAGEINGRVADGGLTTPSQHATGESGGNVEARAGDAQWRVSARTNYLYNSQVELGLNERNFDLGEYRIDGDFESDDFYAGVTFGNHDTGIDNLLMSGFDRRGASLRLGTTDDRLALTGFVQSTEAQVGTHHVTGISHAEDRVVGAAASLRPIAALQDNIVLTGMFYTGEGSDGGFGIGTEEIINEGSGWSLGADTLWFDEALRVSGEYAQSRYDFDGKDQGFGAETADAYSVLASLEPLRGATIDGGYFNWTIGVQRAEVDTFFQSLANPSLQADRETTSVFTNFYWDEFAVQLQLDHTLNNVDDLDYLPTDRSIDLFFNGTYTPFIEPLEDGSLPWYGQPFFGLSASFNDLDRIDRSDDFPDDDADNSTQVITASTGANYEAWSWSFSQTLYAFQDDVGLADDSVNHTSSISAYILVDDWMTLSPSLTFDLFDDRDGDGDNETVNLGLGADFTIIPDTLTASLLYAANLRAGSGATPDSNSLSGEVVWTLRKAEVNQLGVALAVTGFVQDTNDESINPDDELQYQAFTALRLSLPIAY